jgi:hypothetical protein
MKMNINLVQAIVIESQRGQLRASGNSAGAKAQTLFGLFAARDPEGTPSRALERNRMGSKRRLASGDAHSSSKRRSMNGAQFHLPRVCFAGGGLKGNNHFVPSLQDGGQCGVLGPRVPPGAILTISLREMRPCDHEFRSFEGRRRRWTTVTKQQQFGHPGHLPELN